MILIRIILKSVYTNRGDFFAYIISSLVLKMELKNHFGKWLTDAEILLSRVFETKHEERAEELRAKRMEREIMAQRSRSIQQVNFYIILHIIQFI